MYKNLPPHYRKALANFMKHEKFNKLSRRNKELQKLRFNSTLPYVNAYKNKFKEDPNMSFPEFITLMNQTANVGYVNKNKSKIGISNRIIGKNATFKNAGYIYKYLGGRNNPHKYKTYPQGELNTTGYTYNKHKMNVKTGVQNNSNSTKHNTGAKNNASFDYTVGALGIVGVLLVPLITLAIFK
jgi:hypothetical protein